MSERRAPASDPQDSADRREPATERPDIAWLVAVGAAMLLATTSATGLTLAMLGSYGTVQTLTIALTILLCAIGAVGPRRLLATAPRADRQAWSIAALGILTTVAIWVARSAGEHVITRRDPGSYLTTARWLSRTGQLDAVAANPILDRLSGITYTGPAVYAAGAERLEFQFSHGPSVAMASGYDLFGTRGLVGVTAFVATIGLLSVFVLLRHLGVHPALALGAVTSLALCVPMLFVTRNTYSEPYAFAVLWGGVLVLTTAGRRHLGWTLIGSWLIGSTVLFRIDAMLYVLALLLAMAVVVGRGLRRPAMIPVGILGMAPAVAIGLIDHRYFSGGYARDLAPETRSLFLATAAGLVVAITVGVLARSRRLIGPIGQRVAIGAAAVVGAGLVALWLVRPRLQQVTAHWSDTSGYAATVRAIQDREGDELDGLRSYAEHSMAQIGWYFGVVVLLLAIAGLGHVTYLVLRRQDASWSLLATIALVATPLYLWRPSITPDQPWATRRLLPFVIPLFVVAAAIAASRLVAMLRGRALRVVALGASAALFVVPTALTTWPVRDQADQRGALDVVARVCAELDGAQVGVSLGYREIDMPLRAWCGVSVGDLQQADWATGIPRLFRLADDACLPVFLVTDQPDRLEPYLERTGAPLLIDTELGPVASQTLDRAPDELKWQPLRLAVTRVAPDC